MKTWPEIKSLLIRMNNIISNIFKRLAEFFSNITDYITDIPDILQELKQKLTLFIHDQKMKFGNLTETNIDLGKYHLHTGHIKDAILRFRIAKMLFDKDNPEINYWLGWCYFLKPDYQLAIDYLNQGKAADTDGLGDFIKNPDAVEEVPQSIWSMLRSLTILEGNSKYSAVDFYNKPIEIPLVFIEFFLSNVKELPRGVRILDFGCSSGLAGSYLDYKTDAEYYITGVDEHELFIDYIKNLRGERGFIYNKTVQSPISKVEDIINTEKYDVILSFDSLAYVKNFSRYFKSFYQALNKNGFFAILLPCSNKTIWDPSKRSFVYNSNDIAEQLKLAKFDIMDIKEWSLGRRGSYVAFTCKKP
jgi:SAM-dependent methyltransferase